MLKAILAILAVVGLDQAVKYWAVTVLKPIRSTRSSKVFSI